MRLKIIPSKEVRVAIIRTLLLIIAVSFSNFSYSQIDFKSFTNYFNLPESPEVAMLHNFAETPVNLYTGTPNISVDLLGYDYGGYPLNVSINYHPNGLKVNQVPSAVGLGWNLSSGASITRIPRGLIDERSGPPGFLDFISTNDHADVLQKVSNEDLAFLSQVQMNCIDIQPDIYSVSLPNGGFTFTFDWDGSIVHNSSMDVVISFIRDSINGIFDEWSIIDDNGFEYLFLDQDAEVTDIDSPVTIAGACNYMPNGYVSQWNVNTIKNPHHSYFDIYFDYEDYTLARDWTFSDSRDLNLATSECDESGSYGLDYIFWELELAGFSFTTSSSGPPTVGAIKKNWSASTIYGKRPLNIQSDSDDLDIHFYYSNDRQDLAGLDASSSNLKSLDSLQFKLNNNLTKNIHFDHTYSNRLKLDTITERSISDSETKLIAAFEYSDGDLPDYDSYSIDYWGFFNNQPNTTTIPNYFLLEPDFGLAHFISGADRTTSEQHVRYGVLEKIFHPTGGFTEYDFGPNKFQSIAGNAFEAFLSEIPIDYGTAYAQANQNVTDTLSIYIDPPVDNTITAIKISLDFTTSTPFGGPLFLPELKIVYPNGTTGTTVSSILPEGHPYAQYSEQEYLEIFLTNTTEPGSPLTPGLYTFIVKANGNTQMWEGTGVPMIYDHATCQVEVSSIYHPVNDVNANGTLVLDTVLNGGGLRIDAINYFTEYGELAKNTSFEYKYYLDSLDHFYGSSIESGLLTSPARFTDDYVLQFSSVVGGPIGYQCNQESYMRTIYGTNQFSNVSHPPLVYPSVIEYNYSPSSNGLTTYNYSFVPDISLFQEPFPDPIAQNFKSGLLDSSKTYQFINGEFVKVSEQLREYNSFTENVFLTTIGQSDIVTSISGLVQSAGMENYAIATNSRRFGRSQIISEESRTYLETNATGVFDHNSVFKEFEYDDELRYLEKDISFENETRTLVNEFRYKDDFESSYPNRSSMVSALNDFNYPVPVETVSYFSENGFNDTISHSLTHFLASGNFVYPFKIYSKQIGENCPLANSVILSDCFPDIIEFGNYHFSGIPQLFKINGKEGISELDSLRNKVVQCQNCSGYNWAYSSFENNYGSDRWIYDQNGSLDLSSYMGNMSFDLDTSLIETDLIIQGSDQFLLSYWALSDDVQIEKNDTVIYSGSASTYSEFTYHEMIITLFDGTSTIKLSGTAQIDELRIHPIEAQMTSFEFDEYDRLVEQNDLKNQRSEFFYDGFHRYSKMKDHKGQIRSKIDYNLKTN